MALLRFLNERPRHRARALRARRERVALAERNLLLVPCGHVAVALVDAGRRAGVSSVRHSRSPLREALHGSPTTPRTAIRLVRSAREGMTMTVSDREAA